MERSNFCFSKEQYDRTIIINSNESKTKKTLLVLINIISEIIYNKK